MTAITHTRLRRVALGTLAALLLFASLGFRGCPGFVEPRSSRAARSSCPPGTTQEASGLCTREFDTHPSGAPIICPTAGCPTPTPSR